MDAFDDYLRGLHAERRARSRAFWRGFGRLVAELWPVLLTASAFIAVAQAAGPAAQ